MNQKIKYILENQEIEVLKIEKITLNNITHQYEVFGEFKIESEIFNKTYIDLSDYQDFNKL